MCWYKQWLVYMKNLGNSEEYPGPIYNDDIKLCEPLLKDPDPTKSYANISIKQRLIEKVDFIKIPHTLWMKWEKIYGGYEIKRFAYKELDNYTVDIFMQKMYITVRPFKKWMPMDSSVLCIGKKEFVKDLRLKIERILEDYLPKTETKEKRKTRIWKLNDQDIEDIDCRLEKQKTNRNFLIEINGDLLEDTDFLEELSLGDSPEILIETVPVSREFVFKKQARIRPRYTENIEKLTEEEIKKYSHGEGLLFNNIPMKSIVPSNSNMGLTGIENIGNTCYMNSGLQCLSHCQELTKYFLLGIYKQDINLDNPLGQQGKFADAYAGLVENLWKGDNSAINAKDLKSRIVLKSDQFQGFAQQDCQELIMNVLDGLHEDLNRVKKKAYIEKKDYDGKADEILSKEQWTEHLLRNKYNLIKYYFRSIIVDLFCGQFKSKILCQECHKLSITFDPFMLLSVPIPQMFKLEIVLVYADLNKKPKRMGFAVNSCTQLNALTNRIAENGELPPESKIVFYSRNYNKNQELLSPEAKCMDLDNQLTELLAYEYSTKEATTINTRFATIPEKDIYFLQVELQYLSNGILNTQYVSYERPILLAVPIIATIFEIKKILLLRLKDFLKNDSIDILKHYSNYFENSKPPYIIEILNNRPIYTKYLFMKRYKDCEFCNGGAHPGNCIFSFENANENENNALLKSILTKMKNQRELKLSVTFQLNSPIFSEKQADFLFSLANANNDISIEDIVKYRMTLADCIESFTQDENLDKDNLWHCGNCKKLVQATKKMDLYKLPRILIIHLKRFRHKITQLWNYQKKLEDFVEYPTTGLDLSKFIKGAPEGYLYDLFAVSNHYGRMSGGHYTATCYNPFHDKWLFFDDESVSKASTEDIVSNNGYVLFYHRVNNPNLN